MKRDGQTSTTTRSRTQVIAVSASLAACGLLAAASALTLGARLHWLLELTCHFHLQHALVTLLPLVVLLAFRRWKLAILPAVLLMFHLWQLSPTLLPTFETPPAGAQFRAVAANVLTSNLQHEKLLALLEQEDPDLFVLIETDSR